MAGVSKITKRSVSAEAISSEIHRISGPKLAEAKAEWQRRFGKAPPKALSRDLLVRQLAWDIRERALGGQCGVLPDERKGFHEVDYFASPSTVTVVESPLANAAGSLGWCRCRWRRQRRLRLGSESGAGFIRTNPFQSLVCFVLTPVGFMLCAWAARTIFVGSQGSGIPQAIAARNLKDDAARSRLLSVRLTIGKILLTLVGLACGASIGREGPTVQVGASIMLGAAKLGGLGRERGLILAGSAAGVAAAFNTPLAGIVFAIEEMSRAFESRTTGLVLIAVILAGLASLGLVGNYSYFGHSTSMLRVTIDWIAVLVCGISGGLLGACFPSSSCAARALIRAWLVQAPMQRALLLAGSLWIDCRDLRLSKRRDNLWHRL